MRPRLRRFVDGLRHAATAGNWLELGVRPNNTGVGLMSRSECLAGLELQGVTCPVRNLHLSYSWTRADGAVLRGEWADECWFDGSSDGDATPGNSAECESRVSCPIKGVTASSPGTTLAGKTARNRILPDAKAGAVRVQCH